MSIEAVKKYNDKIKKARLCGLDNEENIREYFYELLKNYTNPLNIEIEREVALNTPSKNRVKPDGRIVKEHLTLGYIENKDNKDNLYKEIEKKIEKGYPTHNIIFEDSDRLILYQANQSVLDVKFDNEESIHNAIKQFLSFKPSDLIEFENALDNLKALIPDLADELRDFFSEEKKSNKEFRNSLSDFCESCRTTINDNIDENQAIEIIIQHLLTKDVFIIVFSSASFHESNAISNHIQKTLGTISQKNRDIHEKISEYLDALSKYINRLGGSEKQDVLKVFYENFYKALNPKKSDTQGVVYTPIPIVKFIVRATNDLLSRYFNKVFSSENVNILDPCTGTGLFISEIIESIPTKDLERKYKNEIFANEIDLLPYYIANLNIENAYHNKMKKYEEFDNMCLVDTLEFKHTKSDDEQPMLSLAMISSDNLERVSKQYKKPISVVIGNPPYNANQQSENDNNKNKVYDLVDKKIKATYIAESTAQKTKQFDMYKRFIRWATDRIDKNGVVSFITNNSYLDSKQDDGFRKCVQKEFDYIYIIDLKGNARKNDKAEGQSVFNIMVGTAVMFLIKDSRIKQKDKNAEIHYYNIGDGLNRYDKLEALSIDFKHIEFTRIMPKENGQWLNQVDNDFYSLLPLIDKGVKNIKDEKLQEVLDKNKKETDKKNAIFKLFSLGVLTARDNWAYDMNKEQLENKIKFLLKVYNKERKKWAKPKDKKSMNGYEKHLFEMNKNLDYSIKWVGDTKDYMINNKEIKYNDKYIRTSLYRPFVKSNVYFDYPIMQRTYQNPKLFPNEDSENITIVFNSIPTPTLNTLSSNILSDYKCNIGSGNGGAINTPLYRYENGEKTLNITEWGLKQFRAKYGENVSPRDIFAYCHAVLSSPKYQKKYEQNLKIDYPRIPMYKDFEKYVSLGNRLIKLQTEYENIEAYKDLIIESDSSYMPSGIENPNKNKKFPLMKIDKKNGIITLDEKTIIKNIPIKVFEYKIGSRCAIEWILEYHKPKKLSPEKHLHHKTLIDNELDFYNWKNIRSYLLDLIPRIITVSLETVDILEVL